MAVAKFMPKSSMRIWQPKTFTSRRVGIEKSNCFIRLISSCVSLALCCSFPLAADGSNEGTPVRLTSEEVEANFADENSEWVFRGAVELQRGAMNLRADRMIVKRENGEFVTVVAEGAPVTFEQSQPQSVVATAATMTYSVRDEILVLKGDVEMRQEGNLVRGERIQYDVRKGELVAGSIGTEDGQQIEFILEN